MEIVLLTWGVFVSVLLIYVTLVFLLAQLLHDNSIMDIAYGPAFAIGAIATLVLTDTYSLLPVILATCITLWAARLSIRIGRKNWGRPEDARYAAWRNSWMQRGRTYFVLRSYVQINLLQGIIISIIALPFVVATAAGDAIHPLTAVLGLLVFAIGLAYEALADYQLDRFITRKQSGEESALLMTKGLFKYSRRPNYFGESVIWLGLAITAVSLPFGLLAIASPVLITFIVTKVTGPMLEDIFLEKYPLEYRAYMARTNYFIPGPSRL